jgi:MFS family permease
VWREIGEGLRITFKNTYLRAVCGEAATYNLFEQVILALWVVYASRDLGLSPGVLGAILGTGAIGALIGSLVAAHYSARFGFGRALIGSMVLCCAALALIPLAGGATTRVVAMLALGFFLNGIGLGMSNVYVRSLLQAVTPEALMGRVLASYSFFNTGAIPLGALLGGLLQTVIGLRLTLGVGAGGVLIGLLWVVLSGDLRRLHRLPDSPTIEMPEAR